MNNVKHSVLNETDKLEKKKFNILKRDHPDAIIIFNKEKKEFRVIKKIIK